MNAPLVGDVVIHQYDPALVALSFLISVLGSYVALSLAARRKERGSSIAGAAVALGGCGIWSMHFIAMTAYQTGLAISFSMGPTLLSLGIAILITATGLRIALRGPEQFANLLAGGVTIGLGVVAMHYLGMLGMELRASVQWNWPIVAASVVIALFAATAALWLAFNVKTRAERFAAAVVMGIAVCAMHYTGMSAATLVCTARVAPSTYSLDGPFLGVLIFGFSVLGLAFSILYSRIEAPHARRA